MNVKRIILTMSALVVWAACERYGAEDKGTGELRMAFTAQSVAAKIRSMEIPDTNLFQLTIKNASGKTVYEGRYCDCPESLTLDAGSYTLNVVSSDFSKPAFSSPQYGDTQVVVVPSGGVCTARLSCAQVNSAIRLDVDSAFLEKYPDGVIFLKSAQGKLMYGYSEKRLAYFLPGSVSLILNEGTKETVLMTRTLLAQEVLTLKIRVPLSQTTAEPRGLSVVVDTSRFWLTEDYVIGQDVSDGSGLEGAYTVAQAMGAVGKKDVWVCGYIVGGDLTSASASFEEPFTTKSNILLGPRSVVSSRASCVSVQLPSGSVRDALNLVDNPHLLGTKVYLQGDIEDSYFGLVGIKNVSAYRL